MTFIVFTFCFFLPFLYPFHIPFLLFSLTLLMSLPPFHILSISFSFQFSSSFLTHPLHFLHSTLLLFNIYFFFRPLSHSLPLTLSLSVLPSLPHPLCYPPSLSLFFRLPLFLFPFYFLPLAFLLTFHSFPSFLPPTLPPSYPPFIFTILSPIIPFHTFLTHLPSPLLLLSSSLSSPPPTINYVYLPLSSLLLPLPTPPSILNLLHIHIRTNSNG